MNIINASTITAIPHHEECACSFCTNKQTKSVRLVIIHDTDADGIAAAWAILNGFKNEYSETILIPQRAGDNEIPLNLQDNDSVYLVDRSYPWGILLSLSEQVFSVTVIDHHKTALLHYCEEAVESNKYELESTTLCNTSLFFDYGNITVHIDLTHSACMLAYLWSKEHCIDPDPSIKVPWFIEYIEDRDMWWFKLPDSKAINAGLYYSGITIELLDGLCNTNSIPSVIHITKDIGTVVNNTVLKIIKGIAHGPTVRNRRLIYEETLHGTPSIIHSYVFVCCPFSLISELGDYMLNCKDEEFNTPDVVVCYNQTAEGYIYSLRSKIDVLWLAKKFNGGGHPKACGFSSTLSPEFVLAMYQNHQ